jgi:hypothetical protein
LGHTFFCTSAPPARKRRAQVDFAAFGGEASNRQGWQTVACSSPLAAPGVNLTSGDTGRSFCSYADHRAKCNGKTFSHALMHSSASSGECIHLNRVTIRFHAF